METPSDRLPPHGLSRFSPFQRPRPPPTAPPPPLAPPTSSLYPILPRKDPPKTPVLPADPNSPLIDLLTLLTGGGSPRISSTGTAGGGGPGALSNCRSPTRKARDEPAKGATGSRRYRWTTERKVQLASGQVTHSFLHIPDCSHPLLGRDLLTKLKAQIYFDDKGSTVMGPKGTPLQVLALKLEEEYRLFESESSKEPSEGIQGWLREFPSSWAETGGLGLARDQPPLVIQLKASATHVSIKQYPMSREAHEGIKPHIRRLLDQGVLVPCRSPWNTPLLPVKKPGIGDYRPVQDLREVNKRVEDIHPMVLNPYNLLCTLPPTHIWYTVLDLKDAFFCLRLHPQSQLLFAFEWRDPEMGLSGQLTWTRLPQGFKNSPTLFDEALHSDLAEFRVKHPALILLQYVDDLLLAARTQAECLRGTRALLTKLGQKSYRASAKKAQICQSKVIYLVQPATAASGSQVLLRWLPLYILSPSLGSCSTGESSNSRPFNEFRELYSSHQLLAYQI
ncbi:uncharacterized protein LOC118596762 [Onychomys torridus]|uniref:uncharacterized protein LOC118596762 n=1 Tax=Onychomys torridus TaxID=38674 RepID=UPI00167F99E2|nr:uncharacterized protein LOC118596762 [Onychomys torridus]